VQADLRVRNGDVLHSAALICHLRSAESDFVGVRRRQSTLLQARLRGRCPRDPRLGEPRPAWHPVGDDHRSGGVNVEADDAPGYGRCGYPVRLGARFAVEDDQVGSALGAFCVALVEPRDIAAAHADAEPVAEPLRRRVGRLAYFDGAVTSAVREHVVRHVERTKPSPQYGACRHAGESLADRGDVVLAVCTSVRRRTLREDHDPPRRGHKRRSNLRTHDAPGGRSERVARSTCCPRHAYVKGVVALVCPRDARACEHGAAHRRCRGFEGSISRQRWARHGAA
jgi:hypothetical protein